MFFIMILSNTLKTVQKIQMKTDFPILSIGDSIKVKFLIKEGNKERIQQYEGTIISQHSSGLNKTFTIRRMFQGIGIEYIFPLHSKQITSIEVLRHSKIRRSKLYYLRGRVGKRAQLKTRIVTTLL
jgi:large subunit ribosomal protein L19